MSKTYLGCHIRHFFHNLFKLCCFLCLFLRYIHDLKYTKFEALTEAIDSELTEPSWTRIVENLTNKYPGIKLGNIHYARETKARKLLTQLKFYGWTINKLLELCKSYHLYNALALFIEEQMVIEKQPNDDENIKDGKLIVKLGARFTLVFKVYGIPVPSYQWYKDDKILNGQTQSTLLYENFHPELQGKYHCTATQVIEGRLSTLNSSFLVVEALPELHVEPLTKHYYTKIAGSSFRIAIKAQGHPKPKFVWTFENKQLEESNNILSIKRCGFSDGGSYRCEVKNDAGSQIIKFNLKVLNVGDNPVDNSPVSMKIALIIGNLEYQYKEKIDTPKDLIYQLGDALKKKGFDVKTEFNLTLESMKSTIEKTFGNVENESYMFFFYCGHGIQKESDYFLIPIDCSEKVTYEDCYQLNQIKKIGFETKPRLLVMMMDMCLTLDTKSEEKIKPIEFEADSSNLVMFYSTTERRYAPNSNKNIFLEGLIKYLEDKSLLQEIILKTKRYVDKEYRKMKREFDKKLKDKTTTTEDREKRKKWIKYKPIPSSYDNLINDFDLNGPC